MKTLILILKKEQNPNIKLDEMWGKWIRGHRIIELLKNVDNFVPYFSHYFDRIIEKNFSSNNVLNNNNAIFEESRYCFSKNVDYDLNEIEKLTLIIRQCVIGAYSEFKKGNNDKNACRIVNDYFDIFSKIGIETIVTMPKDKLQFLVEMCFEGA